MAIINCVECQKEISEQAKTCPHCGIFLNGNIQPQKAEITGVSLENPKTLKKIIISLLIFGVLIASAFSHIISKETIRKLEVENKNLFLELDLLKNGAQNYIINLRKLYEDAKYNDVLYWADMLNSKFMGTPEDIEGQIIAKEVNVILLKIEQEREEVVRKEAEEALKSARQKTREIIYISKVRTSKPNSAGGVDVHITWTNKSLEKTIKYASFFVGAYNAVDDEVKGRYSNHTEGLRSTGPFAPGTVGNETYWANVWYNSTITKAVLYRIIIEYTDGTTIELDGKDFDYVW